MLLPRHVNVNVSADAGPAMPASIVKAPVESLSSSAATPTTLSVGLPASTHGGRPLHRLSCGAVNRAVLVVLALACLACVGCTGDEARGVARWQLLVPGQPPQSVQLPGELRIPDAPLDYVLDADVPLTEAMRGHPVSLAVPDTLALGSLRVDGRPALSCVDETFDRYRSDGALCWHFLAPERDTVHLEMRVHHSNWASASFGVAPRLVDAPDGGASFRFVELFNRATAVGSVCIAALLGGLYLLVYLLDRTRRAPLWFAMLALGASLYPLWWLGPTQVLFGPADRFVLADVTCGACWAGLRFTHAELRLGPPHRAWDWAIGAGMLCGVAQIAAFQPRVLTMATAAVIFCATAYQVVVCVRALPRSADRTTPATIGLTWASIIAAAPFDAPALLGQPTPGGGLHFIALATAMVGIGQGTLLARQHVMSLRDADRLNEELRRQIAERSRQLADALAQLAAGSGGERLRPGDTVHDRYRVLRVLGSGGMGEVYEVARIADDRRFALKLLLGHGEHGSLARLAREAEIAAKVAHPNLVSIADIDVTERHGLYIVMELVEGGSLADRRDRWGDASWAVSVLRQVASGLAALHEAGVVHRDLKPANVLVAGDAAVAKITDFGIASLGESGAAAGLADTLRAGGLTRTGIILGTPQYMAPEMANGAREATSAVDVFALGVLAYEILGAGYPFAAPPIVDVISGREPARAPGLASRASSHPPLASVVDASVASLLERCLEIDPGRRPTARALADALAP